MDLALLVALKFVALLGVWSGMALNQLVVFRGVRARSGWLFAIVAILTTLVGIAALVMRHDGFLVGAVLFALIAVARGATVNRMAEERWNKEDTPEAAAHAQRVNVPTAIAVWIALALAVLSFWL